MYFYCLEIPFLISTTLHRIKNNIINYHTLTISGIFFLNVKCLAIFWQSNGNFLEGQKTWFTSSLSSQCLLYLLHVLVNVYSIYTLSSKLFTQKHFLFNVDSNKHFLLCTQYNLSWKSCLCHFMQVAPVFLKILNPLSKCIEIGFLIF